MNTRYDMPENYYFGGGGGTFVTPLSLAGLLLAIGVIVFLPRRQVLVPVLVAGILLPFGIDVVVGGVHFPALRLLIIVAWLRIAMRRDINFPKLNSIDKLFLFYAFSDAIAFTILWGTIGAATNRLGFLSSTIGGYFLARVLIRDKTDVILSIKVLAILIIIIAPGMAYEHVTGHNPFSILGSPDISDVRDGAIRAKGPFAHPIIAGTIGAMLAPTFMGLWWQGKKNRWYAVLGILASAVMVIGSASSTPVMALGAGTVALLWWPLRQHMRTVRRGFVIAIVGLQLLMKAPVWFLISRAGGSMGGSGYHRAMLIDNFIRHFGEWWLVGTQNNASWGYDMWDVDNAYVAAGVGGGVITFALFLALLVHSFKAIGRSGWTTRRSSDDQRLLWTIGCCVFANAIGFFGIVYFDQGILAWYWVLALVSATARLVVAGAPSYSRQPHNSREAEEPITATAISQYCARSL